MNIDQIIELSLLEDIGHGDMTTDNLDMGNDKSRAFMIAKEDGVLAGLDIAIKVFQKLDSNVSYVIYKKDGDTLKKGEEIVKINGLSSAILKGERVALNFLQKLSGIATVTRTMVDIISPYNVKLLDTRKTTPLLRELEKYAVRIGGGYNHRFGLFDMVMIKDNHIEAVGGITEAVEQIKRNNVNYKIEVEVKDLDELKEAVECRIDRVLLDNMRPEMIQEAVYMYGNIVELEVSGGVNLENIEEYAKTGVHFISTGAITHSHKALDISLLIKEI
ncbi:MAG: carboxylating nicotinate-nucleotide diphosphorylase [Candidatus Cloacimonas sp.]|jgi:nicotinate-nucleotide pyrophosphorylase (carboxylating)|nr:carboxylating nicotinate-nucleotide diphosphorylase [Candidatus Cloacimonadota bacterium]